MTIMILPGGQYAEEGLILNLPNDIESVISQLPQNVENAPYLIVKFERNNKFPKEVKTMHVSVANVQDALLWLRENNVLFSDLDIPMSVNNRTFLQNEPDDCHNSEYTNGSVEHQLEEHAMIQL